MWGNVLALVLKELLALLRDRASRMVLVGPPLVQLLVFGYAATFDLNHIPYAVYNEDSGYAARELLARFSGSPAFEQVATLRAEADPAAIVDARDALLVLHLGPHFTRDLLQQRPAALQVLIDGRDSNTASIALNDVGSVVLDFNRAWSAQHGLRAPPAELEMRAWFNPNLLSRWFVVPGVVALLMLVVTLLVTGLSVARERELGTFDQIMVSPLRPIEILLGKALPGLLIGGVEGSLTVLAAVLWFHVPFTGSVLALGLGMFLFLLAAIGLGLMISSLALTQQQGLLGVFMFMVPSVILSGFASPIANMPPAVQLLTEFNPVRHFLVIVRGVFLQGAGVSDLLPQYALLALLGLASLSAAGWLFRHRSA
jgi:ABC-2 type transport system permease protein